MRFCMAECRVCRDAINRVRADVGISGGRLGGRCVRSGGTRRIASVQACMASVQARVASVQAGMAGGSQMSEVRNCRSET